MTHKSHRHILTLIAAALCLMLAACHHASPYRATLDAADSLMESRPDSALSLLRAIPSEQITDRATRARHAMLHAMARDKNYIDDTTFTILQPAIDYYENQRSIIRGASMKMTTKRHQPWFPTKKRWTCARKQTTPSPRHACAMP